MSELPETRSYGGLSILVSAVVGVAAALGSIWWASGFGPFYETLFRVGPTVAGGGVGTDWVEGNTIAELDFLIALIHAADVLMGVFILFMVFLHWSAFRRIAARMRQPGEQADAGDVVADGGEVEGGEDR
ncbi:hypothetical protein [Halosegnis marinus]|uniref:DUF4328 domain-containing protein n=1 Tax=Halosegnis marinus TaxID=3034023 RepID=A0ABD5ZTV5_9EURY|nr:hypothetical protein [Halosegnis sp. DT85]